MIKWFNGLFGNKTEPKEPTSKFFDDEEDVIEMLKKAVGPNFWKMDFTDIAYLQRKVMEKQLEFFETIRKGKTSKNGR